MLIEFFKKLETSKWLPWFGTAPFVLFPILIMFDGQVARGVGLFAFFASARVGIILGGKFAQINSTRVFKISNDLANRFTAASCAFGFLLIPILVGSFTNANLGTNIELY